MSAQYTCCRRFMDATSNVETCAHLLSSTSRRLSNIFQEFPDRGEFPDYYKAIPEPECLDHIAVS